MANRSSQVATDVCEAERFAPQATRADFAQRAKLGFRPCCPMGTHVAPPPTYALGEPNPPKERGLAMWETDGPWVH